MKKTILLLSVFSLLSIQSLVFGERIDGLRQLEPVVVSGGYLSPLYGIPVENIFLYAYDEASGSFSMMPFQIDERTFGPVPETNRSRWYYFVPEEWATIDSIAISAHDGLLSDHDELVFLIGDMGDKAPAHVWIDDEEARANQRLEIIVSDPDNPAKQSFAYLFYSSSIQEQRPTPYGLQFRPEEEKVISGTYEIGLSPDNGLIQDISILPPYGSGVDIFDTQKIRFNGILDFGEIGFFLGKNNAPSANERDNLHLFPGSRFTANPVVRIVREAMQTLKFGPFVIEQAAFFVTTKFYPYSGTLEGGAALDPASLKEVLGGEDDIIIQMDLLRQSFDFNSNAVGMKFYNRYNSGVTIDGVPDAVDKTVDVPINEWGLVTGAQGTVFTDVYFEDTSWQNIQLYYHDSQEGGQADITTVQTGDTGDLVSYGDYGILFESMPSDQDTVSLELDFTAYFLESNKTAADGMELANIVRSPAEFQTINIGFPTLVEGNGSAQPRDFELYQNFPNPFNNSTTFSFYLPAADHVLFEIVDVNGRIVKKLLDGKLAAGAHTLNWDGLDAGNNPLPSGVYFFSVRYKDNKNIRKFSLVR